MLGRNQQEVTEDGPSIIVGAGRIGTMLHEFGQRRSYDDVLLKRGDRIPDNHPGPIYVCVPTADVEGVVASCPDSKKDDLVFLQDGMLEPIFQRNGLYGPTQAALWMVTMRKGGKPIDGLTRENPEGLTTVCGKWSGALAMRLGTGGLTCQTKLERDGRRAMLEKLVFVSAYNLVGAVHGGITVGEVAQKHGDEVGAMVRELASFIRYTLSVSLFSGLDDRLAAYAERVEFLPTRITDFEYRNGYFYRYAKMAGSKTNAAGIKVEIPDTTPVHTDYLMWAKERGVISQSLLDSV